MWSTLKIIAEAIVLGLKAFDAWQRREREKAAAATRKAIHSNPVGWAKSRFGMQPDDKKGIPGFVVIKNTNRRSYDSQKFTFYFNRELVQTGCTIPGSIDYNVVCRFNFLAQCAKGSVLEVLYPVDDTDVKVFSRNC